jgi:hypothetical protein
MVDITFEEEFSLVPELGVHLPVASPPDQAGNLHVGVSQGEVDPRAALVQLNAGAGRSGTGRVHRPERRCTRG